MSTEQITTLAIARQKELSDLADKVGAFLKGQK